MGRRSAASLSRRAGGSPFVVRALPLCCRPKASLALGRLVSCSLDGSVLCARQPHETDVSPIELSAAGCGPPQRCITAFGSAAVSAGDGGVAHVWDVQRGRLETTVCSPSAIGAVAGPAVRSASLGAAGGGQLILGLENGWCEVWGALQ